MQSEVIALLTAQGALGATLLVRRGDGQYAFQRIDPRVASATRAAGNLVSPDVCFPPSVNPGAAS
jgi:hypothetical protein